MPIGNPITLTNNVASKVISVLATSNQTQFTVTGGYRINQLSVFRNGVRLAQGRDFTATDGATVTLVNAATVSDEIAFHVFDDFRVADAISSSASNQTLAADTLNVTGQIKSVGAASTEFRAAVGLSSAGTVIGAGVTQFNFIGAGNTFAVRGNTVDVSISGGARGGGGNNVFFENDQTVSSSYTVTANKNAMSAGPITIANGVTVTVPATSNWVIV